MTEINVPPSGSLGTSGVQLLLWESPSLDPVTRLKSAMREALKACAWSRERIIRDMNELAAREGMTCNGNAQKITEDMLDKWVAAGSPSHVIPLRYLPLFCLVTGNGTPIQAVGATLGLELVGAEDRKLLEWARTESKRRHLAREARRLAQEVGLK